MLQEINKIKKNKIIVNKKAYYNFFIEKVFYSGLSLEGWEVKSIRSGKINISESYIINNMNEFYLCNSLIQPLKTSENARCNATRKRKLLLKKYEIHFLSAKKKVTGYTLIPISLFWKNSWCKLEFGLSKGKSIHDKRAILKKNAWKKEKTQLLKKNNFFS